MASKGKPDVPPFQRHVIADNMRSEHFIPRNRIKCHGITVAPQPDTIFFSVLNPT